MRDRDRTHTRGGAGCKCGGMCGGVRGMTWASNVNDRDANGAYAAAICVARFAGWGLNYESGLKR